MNYEMERPRLNCHACASDDRTLLATRSAVEHQIIDTLSTKSNVTNIMMHTLFILYTYSMPAKQSIAPTHRGKCWYTTHLVQAIACLLARVVRLSPDAESALFRHGSGSRAGVSVIDLPGAPVVVSIWREAGRCTDP
jgi:hypothetical protein